MGSTNSPGKSSGSTKTGKKQSNTEEEKVVPKKTEPALHIRAKAHDERSSASRHRSSDKKSYDVKNKPTSGSGSGRKKLKTNS